MSQVHNIQDATGDVVRHGNIGVSYTVRTVAPTNAAAGFETGCHWINRNGTAGAILYINEGTNASAVWNAVVGAGDLVQLAIQTPLVTIPAASITLTLSPAVNAGRINLVASTGGLALTPPAATGSGNVYTFVCTAPITGGSFTFDAKAGNAADLIYGSILSVKTATTTYLNWTGTGIVANSNLFTFNGTTTGGAAIGDWFQIQDIATHLWLVTDGFTIQSGTVATPFSNH